MTEQERWARVGQALEKRALAQWPGHWEKWPRIGYSVRFGKRHTPIEISAVSQGQTDGPTLLAALEAALGLAGEGGEEAER